jgi:DNA processing protein
VIQFPIEQGKGFTIRLFFAIMSYMSHAAIALRDAISPWVEMGAYEALWSKAGASFKQIADSFKANPGAVPSDFVQPSVAEKFAQQVMEIFRRANVNRFGVRVHGAGEYPQHLRKAEHPVELLYYRGWWDLVDSPCVAVVGTRMPTPEGIARAAKLVKALVRDNFTIVSGLASGVDTIAHKTAIEAGGHTIGVIGTPLSSSYPEGNAELQQQIAETFLLLSQVPVVRHSFQTPYHNKFFFPARNVTMAALSLATVIVEAGETSGTLTQARAALHQGKQLFILDSCFQDTSLTWPSYYEKQGAVRVKDYEDIRSRLVTKIHQDRPA